MTDQQPLPIEDLLARLDRERLDADRLYHAALTALDQALQTVPALPQAPPTFLINTKLRNGIMQAADMQSLRSAALSVVDETNRSLTSAGLALNAAFDMARYALWVAALFALLSGAMAVYTLARMDRDTTT